MATAPLPFPVFAVNQPSERTNQRWQLGWAGRWKATWYCKFCIAHRYRLTLTQVDDFLHLRVHKKHGERMRREQSSRAAGPLAGTERFPDATAVPAGAAPRAAPSPPAAPDKTFLLPFPGTRLNVCVTSSSLASLLLPTGGDDAVIDDFAVLDVAA
jgi:hypothetical protein